MAAACAADADDYGAGRPVMFTIGIDVGGTYTDLVAIDERRAQRGR